jgi:hypothetical protein
MNCIADIDPKKKNVGKTTTWTANPRPVKNGKGQTKVNWGSEKSNKNYLTNEI